MTKTNQTHPDRWTVQIQDADLRARLVAEAKRQDRSIASLIRLLVDAGLGRGEARDPNTVCGCPAQFIRPIEEIPVFVGREGRKGDRVEPGTGNYAIGKKPSHNTCAPTGKAVR